MASFTLRAEALEVHIKGEDVLLPEAGVWGMYCKRSE